MSPITTHVLDTAIGRPAAGVSVTLEVNADGSWKQVGKRTTNQDGRITDLLSGSKLATGTYRLTFDTGAYFKSQKRDSFYPQVQVEFTVTDLQGHYHIPLLLSSYGYSTYRGS